MIPVHHGEWYRPWKISKSVIFFHLPMYAYTFGIDLPLLARNYCACSGGRLSESSALDALRAFFNILRSKDTDTIIQRLHDLLEKLLRKNRIDGLSRLRNHFSTLAFLAQQTRSNSIADCLIAFFLEERHTITMEDFRHLDDWKTAIRRLRHLVFPLVVVHEALNFIARKQNEMSYYHPRNYDYDSDDDDRGRRLHRWDRWDRRHSRARTMPPVYYPPVPRIEMPPVNHWIRELPSPSIYDLNDPCGDEVEDLRDRVENLESNQFQIAAEMGAVVPSPFPQLRLPY